MDQGDGRGVHWAVRAFVAFHIFAMVHWSLPAPARAVANGSVPPTAGNVLRHPVDFALLGNEWLRFRSPHRYYLLTTGVWQYWDMFAPNPADLDYWYDAKVTYADGSESVYAYPRMKRLPLGEKYLAERYRKFIERTNNDATDKWKWPTFAQRIALLATQDEDNLPVRVELWRHFRKLEGPAKGEPGPYQAYRFFTYVVDPERLRKDLRP